MNVNLFASTALFSNDIEDFKLPYKLTSKTDKEVMQDKYMKLRKTTYGYIVRLGIPENR
jgi:hypothetical protein